MTDDLVSWERLGDYGELRVFTRSGPPRHLAAEILRESDGRAWTLRIGMGQLRTLSTVLKSATARLVTGGEFAFDADGIAILTSDRLAEDRELFALVLEQEGELVFALWTREHLRSGWTWSLEALFVPLAQSRQLVELLTKAMETAKRPTFGRPRTSALTG